MEPSLEQTNPNVPSANNAYRSPKKPKGLLITSVILGVLAVAGITFCAYVAFQSYEKNAKITDLETKVSALDTRITELAEQLANTPTTPVNGALSYEILGESDDSTYSQQGYYVEEQEDGTVKVTIAMGASNTGGYAISIDNIELTDDGAATIYVTETSPAEGEPVTTAFTYPATVVEFSKLPSSITVQSSDGTTEYTEVSVIEEVLEDNGS